MKIIIEGILKHKCLELYWKSIKEIQKELLNIDSKNYLPLPEQYSDFLLF